MATESDLRRYRTEASRLRAEVGKASGVVATQRKKAADARAAAGRTKSAQTARSKLAEAEKAERAANGAESKRAGLEKKLAAAEDKIVKAQNDVQTKKDSSNKRTLDALRRDNDRASRQFRDLRSATAFESVDTPGGPNVVTSWPSEHGAVASPVHDVFLSHASEDKDAIARPLKEALEERGLSVWFDEIKIRVGQSIRQEIEKGIASARFGVVIVSPAFFKKQWTQAELDALFARRMDSGRSMILPVWHHISKDEVLAQSPLLAGVLALNSSLMTVDEMADEIASVAKE